MNCLVPTSSQSPVGKNLGMTLVEMMVAVGLGSIVLTVMAIIFMTSTFSFASMGHYTSMNRDSRNALDEMTRNIRKSKDLVSFATNRLVFNYQGSTNSTLIYNYDPATRQLGEWKTGDTKTNILLTDCDYLEFSMYKNVPLAGATFGKTTVPSQGKVISVNWTCSRTTVGKKMNTEDMAQALIVIRNKPVL